MKTIVIIIIAAAAVVALTIVGVDFFSAVIAPTTRTVTPTIATPKPTASVTPSPTVTVTATPTSTTTSTPTPTTLEQNITNLEQAINSVAITGKSKEVTITISESEANAQAVQMLSTATMPPDVPLEIKGVTIDFKSGNIIVASIDIRAVLEVTARVQLGISIQSGKPVAKVTKVSFPLSAFLPQVTDQITALVTQQIDELIVQLTSTQLAGGKVTLEYLKIDVQENSAAVTVLVKPI